MKYILLIFISTYAISQDFQKISCGIATHKLDQLIDFTENTQEVIKYLDEKSRNRYDYRCDLSAIESTDEYIIAIDGANSYTPIEFELSRLNSIKASKDEKLFDKLDFKNKALSKLISKEQDKKSFSPMTQLLLNSKTKLKAKQESLYFSHANPNMAYRCIKEIKEKKPNIKIKIMAYSWGGNSAQKVINKLERDQVNIESVLLIDPVRKGFLGTGVIKNITGTKDSGFFKKNSNVKKLTSVYQKTNTKALAFIAIRGNPVDGADRNIDLTQKCTMPMVFNPETKKLEKPTLGHLSLGFCQETRNEFRNFVLN